MQKNIPIITRLVSSYKVYNKKGFRFFKENRESSVFIIVLEGKIRFTSDREAIVATPDAPIYIPHGTTYLNECLESAESLLFNFDELSGEGGMHSLSRIDRKTAERIFERIFMLQTRKRPSAEAETFSLLYDIVRDGYAECTSREGELIDPALRHIELHLDDPDLTVSELAALCRVSTVYLNRIFKKELGKTPFAYVTERRMETAANMLREHCSVGETVRFVGYSDVYQFSRAFKRYYGVSPKSYERESRRHEI